jgi:hypothetical protein
LERGKKKPKPAANPRNQKKSLKGQGENILKNGPIKSHKKAQIKLGTPFSKGVGKIHPTKKQITHWRR